MLAEPLILGLNGDTGRKSLHNLSMPATTTRSG